MKGKSCSSEKSISGNCSAIGCFRSKFFSNPLTSALHIVPADGVKNLTLGAYVPLTGPCWGGGFAVKIVIELALRQVNNRTDILSDYQLHMVLNDTKVRVC